MTKKIDNTNVVDIMYLDFQKAFDKVPHNRFMNKVKGYGVRGQAVEGVLNWLQHRY